MKLLRSKLWALQEEERLKEEKRLKACWQSLASACSLKPFNMQQPLEPQVL
jgi:hypothetical protein